MRRVLILGGGPAGYVAALRASQLGASVALVESREIGGTCLNRGCVPTKAIVAGAERLRAVREAAQFGVRAGEPRLDFPALMSRKEHVTDRLREGVEHLLRGRKVEVVRARGRLAGPGALKLDDGRVLEGDRVILAPGSEPMWLPLLPRTDPRIVSSDGLLRLGALPPRLLVVGGGVIGCEFAAAFAELGSRVTVVEILDQLLAGEDKRPARALQQAFRKRGIDVRLKTSVSTVDTSSPATVGVSLSSGERVEAEVVLASVGRRAATEDLDLDAVGVGRDERGFIVTDETQRTSVDGVFAAGDAAAGPLLAHWAYRQGAAAAENAVTDSRLVADRHVVPSCVFTHPEVASCGVTEDRAAAAGLSVQIAHIRLNGNSRAVIEGEEEGFVRIVCDASDGVVIGGSIVGPRATELIHEIAVAAQNRLPLEGLVRTIHAHPTLAEAIGEAALVAAGKGLHSL